MRMIISPAKQMRVDTDTFDCNELPVFLDKTKILKDWIRSLSYEQQKTLGPAMTKSPDRTPSGLRRWIFKAA